MRVRYLIKNGSIIDPVQRVINLGHVLVEDGVIKQVFDLAEMSPDVEPAGDDIEVIYAQACIVAPGFTDLQTHLCQPGYEQNETIASGTQAAAQGGFTTVCALPTTSPTCDSVAAVDYIRHIAEREAWVHVDIVGTVTLGREGKQLTDMATLAKAGCIAFSDDDRTVEKSPILRHAMEYAAMLGVPIMSHCNAQSVGSMWAMHEGDVSFRLGIAGFPASAEEARIANHIALAELTGTYLHCSHVSTAGGVRLIRQAKERGIRVTADVTPHHLTLTDRWVSGELSMYDNQYGASRPAQQKSDQPKANPTQKLDTEELKMPLQEVPDAHLRSPLRLDPTLLPPFHPNTRVLPPLRSQEHVEALIQGLCDGTIDAIATDHTPRAIMEKDRVYEKAPVGISGLETALPLALALVNAGALDLMDVVARFNEGPAQILGRAPSTLRPGSKADIVIFDPEQSWTVDTAQLASMSKNSPLHGQQLKGQVMLTMAGGKIVFRRDEFGKQTAGRPRASVLTGILTNGEEDDL
jgi:dihydroorotase